MKRICRSSIIFLSFLFIIPSAVLASSNPQSNCSYGGSESECTTYGRKPLTELELMQLAQMNAQAAAAEAQRALQAQAKAAAQEAERRRQAQECGSKKGSISGSLSGCKATASSTKSRTYNNCPVETEVSTGISVGLGNINVKTSPRQTCIQNADAAFTAAVDACEANASNALAALPAYCF